MCTALIFKNNRSITDNYKSHSKKYASDVCALREALKIKKKDYIYTLTILSIQIVCPVFEVNKIISSGCICNLNSFY